MSMSYANILDRCEQFLQDASNATFSTTELGLILDDIITEVSGVVPYVMRDVYQLETRTGSVSATSANNLVDSGESQFLSTDTGKVVFNADDKTWAVITSYSSASQVGLSKDIFTSGERYEIYNAGCWSKNQINVNNSDDLLWIVSVSYPTDRSWYTREISRSFNMVRQDEFNNILEIDAVNLDDTKNTDANKDVYVYLAKQHKLNAMTDLAGAVNNGGGYATGTTSMAVNGLQASGTILKDTLFHVAVATGIDSRLVYRVTTDATITTNAATMSFYPGLEAAVVNTAVVTFLGSTLTPQIERVIVQIVAGEALMSKSITNINNIVTGEAVSTKQYSTGERMAEKARVKLHRLADTNLRVDAMYSRS